MTEWFIAAPFIHGNDGGPWLTRFIPNEDGSLKFRAVPAQYVHDGSRKITGVKAWSDCFVHANAVWNKLQQASGPHGVVTSFAQLAVSVGLRKRIARSKIPLVAWTFNLGHLHPGVRRGLSRISLDSVDRFVVHSRAEIAAYSEWLNLPAVRFRFVPLQCPTRVIEFDEDRDRPFLLSMGSAQRDYALLFSVLKELEFPAVVVAAPHAVAGLDVPSNVVLRSGLNPDQCFELVQRARLSVIPVSNQATASGQVTLLDAMMFGRPVVMTACIANADYVSHGHDAMLVKRGDFDDLKATLARLWDDDRLRATLALNARTTATEKFSDEAIGKVMGDVLRELSPQRG